MANPGVLKQPAYAFWFCVKRQQAYPFTFGDWEEQCHPTATMDKGTTAEWDQARRDHQGCGPVGLVRYD